MKPELLQAITGAMDWLHTDADARQDYSYFAKARRMTWGLHNIKYGGYEAIRTAYWEVVYDAVQGYLEGDRPVTAFRNAHSWGMGIAFTDAVYLGYEEGGGGEVLDEDTLSWLSERIAQERTYIFGMFDRLKQEWEGIDPIHEAFARADGYAATLDAIYSEAKLRGGRNVMLTFAGSDGKESCPDCQRMKGQRHRARWWVEHNMMPGPGNTNYQCNGYNCEHILVDDNGVEWTK